MSLSRKITTLAAPLALLALGACATPFRADVARFQSLPVPQGQTFYVQAADPKLQGGLEFAQYAALVSQRLAQQGYQPAASARAATLVVMIDYGVDDGREKVVTTPGFGGFGGWGYPGFGYGGWGYPYGRFGYGGYRSAFFWGWNDPFWGGSEVSSYTVYTSHLEMTINRTANGERVFEGKAKAHSSNDNLTELVPNLVEAMFTNFPGRSGEEVKITIPPPARS